jgi:hypothetical protein
MWIAFALSACSTPAPEAPPAAAPPSAAPAPTPEAPAPAPRAVADRPPTIEEVRFKNDRPRASENVEVVVRAMDPEGAPVDLDYEWYVNDTRVVGVSSERLFNRFKKGDRVRVRVTAEDAGNEVSMDSPDVVIANTAPEFETRPQDFKKVDGFRFRATDADGDRLAWRLENAPAGMSISTDGVLSYQGSKEEPGGEYKVSVIVEDGEAWGRFDFPLSVSPGSKAGKP